MQLLMLHPEIATRDCNHCHEVVYDSVGKPLERQKGTGLYVLRPAKCPPPCRMPGVGCPKGTPENPRSLNERNWQALEHYLQCREVGYSELERSDPICRRNAEIIGSALRTREQVAWSEFRANVLNALRR